MRYFMSVDVQSETDFEESTRLCKKIQIHIPSLIKNLETILNNDTLLNNEQVKRSLAYINVGSVLIQLAIDEADIPLR
jgi:hypothetical protein